MANLWQKLRGKIKKVKVTVEKNNIVFISASDEEKKVPEFSVSLDNEEQLDLGIKLISSIPLGCFMENREINEKFLRFLNVFNQYVQIMKESVS